MGSIIEAATYDELRFMCSLLPYAGSSEMRGIKLVHDGKLHAIVAYDNWTPNSVQMHIWSLGNKAKWTRLYIQECLRYPFEICNKGLVIGVTPGDNTRALEFNRRLGFKQTYIVRDGWSLGTDVVIQEMRREECRWLPRRNHGIS